MADRIAVMGQGGRMQQIGSADDLLERPANLFVAGFIGNPPMNVLEGVLQPGNPARVLGDGINLTIPEPFAASLAQLSSNRVTVGVRPDAAPPTRRAASRATSARSNRSSATPK